MKNKKSLIAKITETATIKTKRKSFRAGVKITAVTAIAAMLVLSTFGCSAAKNGKDGLNGKNGADGVATSVAVTDGKVTLDKKNTDFNGETLSALINLSINDPASGKVNGGGRYALNTAILISAEPNEGYTFLRWENGKGETVSESQSFLTSATETEQNYTAVFEIDKSKAAINVNVRADKSLPDGAIIEGGGRFSYGSEYTLRVTAEDEKLLSAGTVLYYEVTKEQFDDESFAISFKEGACARGRVAVFDVDGLTDKYYLAAFIDEIYVDVSIDYNITIEAACDIEVISSDDFYGTAEITKINAKNAEKDSFGELQAIWAGDSVTVTAKPAAVTKFDDADEDYQKLGMVNRSDFVCWIDEITGETVSENREYTFVAKKQVHLKAIFAPKTVLHFEASGVLTEIITKEEVVSQSFYLSYNGAVAGFYPGEEIFVHAYFSPLNKYAKAERLTKFVWQISYDNINWETLSYSRQAYLKIPENTPMVYIKATFDKKA